jgi:hypothetical protein
MKLAFVSMATLLLAAPALAQTVTPVEPPPPPPREMTPPPAPDVATLTERDGKWWNGDREATPAEIEAYKKAQRDGRPK